MEAVRRRGKERLRVLANWDPTFPGERINWREEYMQRHAEVAVSWFKGVGGDAGQQDRRRPPCEVTGVGILYASDGEVADKIIGALEDGSVCIWEAEEHGERGRVFARSKPGLLTSSKDDVFDLERTKAIMTETGAVECVSVDSATQRAYVGVLDDLVEVDLRTLRVISREKYPFPITALSEAKFPTPVTVGTNMTIHLYDPRDSKRKGMLSQSPPSTRIELIAGYPSSDFSRLHGSSSQSHATLAQPGQ
jgi:WD40 repeat protein